MADSEADKTKAIEARAKGLWRRSLLGSIIPFGVLLLALAAANFTPIGIQAPKPNDFLVTILFIGLGMSWASSVSITMSDENLSPSVRGWQTWFVIIQIFIAILIALAFVNPADSTLEWWGINFVCVAISLILSYISDVRIAAFAK